MNRMGKPKAGHMFGWSLRLLRSGYRPLSKFDNGPWLRLNEEGPDGFWLVEMVEWPSLPPSRAVKGHTKYHVVWWERKHDEPMITELSSAIAQRLGSGGFGYVSFWVDESGDEVPRPTRSKS